MFIGAYIFGGQANLSSASTTKQKTCGKIKHGCCFNFNSKCIRVHHCIGVLALMISRHFFYTEARLPNTGIELNPHQSDFASGEKRRKGLQSYNDWKDNERTVQSRAAKTVFSNNVRSCVTFLGILKDGIHTCRSFLLEL